VVTKKNFEKGQKEKKQKNYKQAGRLWPG